jgi:pimeloyl-ACP methyl ester carboxylesterase
MQRHRIIGGDGVELNVMEAGDPNGRPIVFIHGFTQSLYAWSKQLNSDLADDFRLVAFDLRGHGESDKPSTPESYTNSKLWADDVNAIITELRLDRPVLVGWSYAPLIILDYVRHYGESDISGMHFVGGITKLGTEEATQYLTPDILNLVPGLFSSDAIESGQSLRSLIDLFFASEPAVEDIYFMLGYETTVPPVVRQSLFSRVLDNDDILSTSNIPLLITHGAEDRVVFPPAAAQIASVHPHAELDRPDDVGHGAFWEDPEKFNARLREFVTNIPEVNAARSGE